MSIEIHAAVLAHSGKNPRPYADTPPLVTKKLMLADPLPSELLVRTDAPGI